MQDKFKDFKTFYVNDQFHDIYVDLYHGYKRRDLVMLQRSLSDYQYEYFKHIMYPRFTNKEEDLLAIAEANPFCKKILGKTILHAGLDEVRAQITMKYRV